MKKVKKATVKSVTSQPKASLQQALAGYKHLKAKKEELVHPKCPGCGHNYFDAAKLPLNKDGTYPKLGLCKWCADEENERDRLQHYYDSVESYQGFNSNGVDFDD